MKGESAMKASVYLKAAKAVDAKRDCGCCAAIINAAEPDASDGLQREFSAWFKPRRASDGDYWYGSVPAFRTRTSALASSRSYSPITSPATASAERGNLERSS